MKQDLGYRGINMITLKLECIGDDRNAAMRQFAAIEEVVMGMAGIKRAASSDIKNRAWVAIIKDYERGQFIREFPRGYKDYSESNSKGSRGVYKYYYLEECNIYEVSEPTSWKNTSRYFCRIVNGALLVMEKEEVVMHFKQIRNSSASIMIVNGEKMSEEEYWEWMRKKS